MSCLTHLEVSSRECYYAAFRMAVGDLLADSSRNIVDDLHVNCGKVYLNCDFKL